MPDEDLNKITTWVSCRDVKRSGFAMRFFDEWKVAKKIFTAAQCRRADYTLATTPFLSFLLIAPWFVTKNQLVYDVRDLTWEYKVSSSFIVSSLQRAVGMWALHAIRKSVLVATTTVAEKQYLESRVPGANVVHIANGIEEDVLLQLARTAHSTTAHNIRHVVYAGTVGVAQGIDILGEAALMMPDVRFTVIGDGSAMRQLREKKREMHLENLLLYGSMPRSKVLGEYINASVLFVRLRAGFSTAVPSKVYEYLATGRPIVYMGAETDAAWQVLADFPGTYRADDEDHAGLFASLRKALGDGRRASVYNRDLTHLTRESQSHLLLQELRRKARLI